MSPQGRAQCYSLRSHGLQVPIGRMGPGCEPRAYRHTGLFWKGNLSSFVWGCITLCSFISFLLTQLCALQHKTQWPSLLCCPGLSLVVRKLSSRKRYNCIKHFKLPNQNPNKQKKATVRKLGHHVSLWLLPGRKAFPRRDGADLWQTVLAPYVCFHRWGPEGFDIYLNSYQKHAYFKPSKEGGIHWMWYLE